MRTFQELLEDAGFDTMEYSGRGMFGSKCLAIELSQDETLGRFVSEVIYEAGEGKDNLSWLSERIAMMVTDSLGMGTVVYFPKEKYNECK
jgi:hypothetical protein